MKIKRYISLYLAALLCMIWSAGVSAAESAELLIYAASSKIAVVGSLDKSAAGDDVSLLLLKNTADPQNLSEGDIGYIEDAKVDSDGTYTFKFPFDGVSYQDGRVANYQVYVTHKNKSGEDVNVTTSVTEATAIPEFTNTVLNIKPGVTTLSASVKVNNLFGLENLGYNLFVACYNEAGELISVYTTNDKALPLDEDTANINITIPENTNLVKAFVFNSTMNIIPLCASQDYAYGAVTDLDITFPTFTKKCVTFSFDDGREGYDNCLLDMMNANGIKGTFNMVPSSLRPSYPELYAGHELNNHTRHEAMYVTDTSASNYVTLDTCKESILVGHNAIEDLFGVAPRGLTWPYNDPDERSDFAQIIEYMESLGYVYARDSKSDSTSFDMPDAEGRPGWLYWETNTAVDGLKLHNVAAPEESPIYQRFLAEAEDDFKMLSIWGHAHDFPDHTMGAGTGSTTLVQFEAFLEMLGKNDSIWSATIIDVYDYEQAAKAVQANYEATGKLVNDTDVTLYGFVNGVKCEIAPNGAPVPVE